MAKKTEMRWVIVGEVGLYVGQEQTRAAMIAKHVSERLSGMKVDRQERFGTMHAGWSLDAEHRRAWNWCKRKGDRCIRVAITYQV
jgi:hypothetical protein